MEQDTTQTGMLMNTLRAHPQLATAVFMTLVLLGSSGSAAANVVAYGGGGGVCPV